MRKIMLLIIVYNYASINETHNGSNLMQDDGLS